MTHGCTLQMQPDTAAYASVLAALLEGGQLQASFSVMSDMRGQGRPDEDASCNHLVAQLLSSNQLDAAVHVMQVSC